MEVLNMANYEIRKNDQYNSLEIYFAGVPEKETREALKALKFRWNPKKGCWYGFAEVEEVKKACGAVLVIPESTVTEAGTLYEGYKGGNCDKWTTDEELKKYILADLKRCGIKATLRFGRGDYTTAFTLTITIKPEMIKTFEEWEKNYKIAWNSWNYYENEAGKLDCVWGDKLINCEDQELLENLKRTAYKLAVNAVTDKTIYHAGQLEALTDEGNATLATVQEILTSYNRDNSNGQIDYFDRAFYSKIAFKVAA